MDDTPRLTRGELRALVDNVISRRNKSLLVVLPVPASGAPLEELYTVRPVTQLLSDGTTTPLPQTTSRKPLKRRRKPHPRPIYVSSTQVPLGTTERVTRQTTATSTESGTKKTTTVKGWSPLSELIVPEDMQQPLDGISVSTTARVFVTPQKTTSQKPITSESPLPPADVAIAAQSLTPEMKELLATFGLLGPEAAKAVEAAQQKTQSTTEFEPLLEAAIPEVDPAAYLTFKPLPPAAGEMAPDMRGFLASFGLIPDNDIPLPPKRSKKVTREERRREPRVLAEAPQMDTDILPESMSSVLTELGLAGELPMMNSRSGREHVFSPGSSLDAARKAAAERLIARLRALSREQDPSKLTPAHLKEVLGEDAALLEGPNPINVSELLNLAETEGDDDSEGGDFKRQQPEELRGLQVMDQTSSSAAPSSSAEASSSSAASGSAESSSAAVTSDVIPSEVMTQTNEEDESTSRGDSTSASSSAATSSSSSSSSDDSSPAAEASSAPSLDDSSSAAAASSSASSNGEISSAAAASASSDGSSSAAAASSGDASSTAIVVDSSAAADGDTTDNESSRTTEGPSIQDLEDSFGGEITTTPRPNGLYFLLDWNSFLQVGQDERKVDLSFNPKIGDPRNFYPIRFP